MVTVAGDPDSVGYASGQSTKEERRQEPHGAVLGTTSGRLIQGQAQKS
jgi:hypothetical protein